MTKTNKLLTKPFFTTLFWKQNRHHQHGVFLHTLRVAWHALIHKDFKMIPAALLHDIGKPVVAYQKEEDIPLGEYSFTDHEEKSYEMIQNIGFISEYTKTLVRWHYLIRDISKHKIKDPQRYMEKKKIWDGLSDEMKTDLKRFLKYDDLAKGKIHKEERSNDRQIYKLTH